MLIVEDDFDLRELLAASLREEGYRAAFAPDGPEAMKMVERGDFRPDLILADFNLPNGMNGLEVISALQEELRRFVPAIILTGDISAKTLGAVRDAGRTAVQQAGRSWRSCRWPFSANWPRNVPPPRAPAARRRRGPRTR